MADPYYITTAIAYPNGKPHIGHAYEAIAADAIARFHRMQGKDVRLVTGTDEHGLKMAQTARAAGRDTLEFATEMSNHFREMCARLNVQYDDFCRTTEERHKQASIALWQALEASGDLYLDRYEGWYSVRDEAFYDEKELVAGEGDEKLSPQGTPVEWTVEESWFFRLSKYRDWLIELNETPGFLEPESRRNEVLSFLKGNELRDLSVSRTSFDWGVPVPGSPGHVMYVWIDALTTYLTGIGYPDTDRRFRALLARRSAPDRQGHRPLPRGLLASDFEVGGSAGAEENIRPRLPAGARREDVEIARQCRRSDRTGGPVRGRCPAVFPAARGELRAGWEL